MKRVMTVLISLAVVLAMYAALDDITTGAEPSHLLEWTFVVAAIAWFAGLAIMGWLRNRRTL